jgi:polyhydroxybutyrate depolymerase
MTVDCRGATPTSVLHIHGLQDSNVPYEGGMGNGYARDVRPSVPATIARWRGIDGCGATRASKVGPVRTDTARCRGGREVTLITIEGARHQWPGSEPPGAVGQAVLGLDDPSGALDATRTLWEFFRSKRR